MRVAVSSDHAGFELKQQIVEQLQAQFEVIDLGPKDSSSVDYPDMATAVCEAVAGGECERGVLICGTGIGMSMAANKMPGIRAALCRDEFSARLSRQHNDANVLVLGARVTGSAHAQSIISEWFTASFDRGRHERRLVKLAALDAGRGGRT